MCSADYDAYEGEPVVPFEMVMTCSHRRHEFVSFSAETIEVILAKARVVAGRKYRVLIQGEP